ncbi:sulfatase-like hydrolase/transferase [Roseiconus nitratireducens]|uniref:Sulfatase-like hydrolase/transferase n=1 Tax=Roseiconus nitratireducens TaxID=2605748 RepID=A0A5M6DI26_9BACT|nr:sulfatase-like hydrolase/transferase [Roseiconus nitratireducens]KAA5545890.1 sulfatase-like hydrolase/transferase [Roseiconus nitratireducens]
MVQGLSTSVIDAITPSLAWAMNRIIQIAVALCCFAVGSHPTHAGGNDTRPNILLILCDDLGYADVGFNAELFGVRTEVVTPNIDAIAKAGMVFRQAYVAHPFCGPSRMGLMSGRMPHCFGGQKNLPDVAKNLEDYNDKGIPQSETLISTLLQRSGYRTGCIGKWHMGDAKPFRPCARGFDHFFGFLGGGHHYFPSVTDKTHPKVNDYQYLLRRSDDTVLSPDGEYLTDMFSEEAVSFITQQSDEPFFLYLAYNAPHSPLQGKAEDLLHLFPNHQPSNPANGIDFHDYSKRQNYVAMVYAVDRGIGQIANALRDPNRDGEDSDSIMESTLIVFLSDNGGKILQAGNNAPLSDDKGSTHEGGIRVPMFMHWPRAITAGSVFNDPILAMDLYPTFAGLAQTTVPAEKVLDGKDIWNDIQSGTNPHAEEFIPWLRHHGSGNEVAIRKGDMKAYRKMGGKWQIHNIVDDPGETTNVADQNADLLRELVSAGYAWSKTLQDPRWHDTAASLESWIENQMPGYHSTFQIHR